MKLTNTINAFEGRLPEGNRHTFVIKSNPHLFNILSDGIYSDKIAAVIRELSCNARDSNVTARSAQPFKVSVPTNLDSNFWVEDTGLGIDPEKIVDIFWTYGSSTKTNSNETIGALGLGSKSPFAYTKSSFLVINRYNGVEYKYFCFINEVGIPDGKLMYQSVTTEPNGVRVELAVRQGDIGAFRERIIRFFSFWGDDAMPTFVNDSTVAESITKIKKSRSVFGKTWQLRNMQEPAGGGAFAVMGGVPYPINLRALGSPSKAMEMIGASMINIVFPMGSLEFQVSREELSYTDATIAALEAGASGIAQELLDLSIERLTGFQTPFELYEAYHAIIGELNTTFPHMVYMLRNCAGFKLADGRVYTPTQLDSPLVSAKAKAHVPFNVQLVERQYRVYTKGQQRFTLTANLKLKLNKSTAANTQTPETVVSWFNPAIVAAPWNQRRQRTAANFKHEGYEVIESVLSLHTGAFKAAFIINDLGLQGTEGIRFYTGAFGLHQRRAFSAEQLFYVDGVVMGLDAAATERELAAFVKGTLFEGAPIVRLSQLPDFKMLEAPKAEPKPKKPQQRGTIEQRMSTYRFNRSAVKSIDQVNNIELEFTTPNFSVTEYTRHELIKPMLYVNANWGSPASEFDKACLKEEVIGALHALDLLHEFEVVTADGVEIRVGRLSPSHIEELKRRNVRLVSFDGLLTKVQQLFEKETQLHEAFQQRASKLISAEASSMLFKLLSKKFIIGGLKHLPKSNVIAKLALADDHIRSLLNNKRCALLSLVTKGWKDHIDPALSAKLNGTIDGSALRKYPLLFQLASGYEWARGENIFAHVAFYINSVDEMIAKAEEAKRLEQLAQLQADAIFEEVENEL